MLEASQPSSFDLPGKLHFAEEFRIGDDKRDVALVEHGDDPIDQQRRRDIGPAHARRGGNAGARRATSPCGAVMAMRSSP